MAEKPRNIQERAFEFGVRVICLVNRLPRTNAGNMLGQQLLRAGTSVGANMQEADGAESKKDFIHKTGIALKEAKEARYWLRLLNATLLPLDSELQALQQEARELSLILGAIKSKASKPQGTQTKDLPAP
jgi:four helix bundle protein